MLIPATDKLEMIAEAAVVQHMIGIAADREDATTVDAVMFIQYKGFRVVRDGAFIDHCLAVVFAVTFQLRQFKQTIGR